MTMKKLNSNSEEIACKHVVQGKKKVALVYLSEDEYQFVCGENDHSSYYDFKEIGYSHLCSLSNNIISLDFPSNTNLAEYDIQKSIWRYSEDDVTNLNPVDGIINLNSHENDDFICAVKRIIYQQGFWVSVGSNNSIGGRTLPNGSKYICIWDRPVGQNFVSKLVTFVKRKNHLDLSFLLYEDFKINYKNAFETHDGFIIHSKYNEFGCSFEDFDNSLKMFNDNSSVGHNPL